MATVAELLDQGVKAYGGTGDYSLDGGPGMDTAVFGGMRADYLDTRSGAGWTVSGGNYGTDTLAGVEWLQFGDARVRLGGEADFDSNRDARTDLLWRSTDGTVALWTMDDTMPTFGAAGIVGPEWQIAASTGDYDGDNRSDILWRHDSGTIALWTMNGATPSYGAAGVVGPEWHIAEASGDYDRDGKSDILWRNDPPPFS